jgi:hypothetical protein
METVAVRLLQVGGISIFQLDFFFRCCFSFFFSYIFLDNLITCRTQGEIHTTHRRSHAAFSFPFFPWFFCWKNIKRALLRDTQSAAHIQGYITIYMIFSGRGFDVIALVRIRPGDARKLGIARHHFEIEKRKDVVCRIRTRREIQTLIHDSTAIDKSLSSSPHTFVYWTRRAKESKSRERWKYIYKK